LVKQKQKDKEMFKIHLQLGSLHTADFSGKKMLPKSRGCMYIHACSPGNQQGFSR